jgi:PST family polysaccharide transporter
MLERIKILSKILLKSKVAENYFFMTLLQVVSPLIAFIVYPYVIETVGPPNYGLYILALSASNYLLVFISYGFSWTGLRDISCNQNNHYKKSRIVSTVLISKGLLFSVVFTVCYFSTLFIPVFQQNRFIFLFCFLQITVPDILFPSWFFQGIQKMKVVTYIQLFIRLLTIPLVFAFIKKNDDITVYAAITSGCAIFGALIASYFLFYKEKIRFYFIPYNEIKLYFKEGFSFFCTNIVGTAKKELLPIVTGYFLGLYEVAIYDLACKIISIPTMLTDKINGAVFPEIIKNPLRSKVKKIMKLELIISALAILSVVLLGYWAVLLLGGEQMIKSYPVACILSITVLTNLLSGNCMNLVFIPNKKYYYITQLQLVALVVIIILCIPVIQYHSVYAVAAAAALSGISEIAYSFYRIKTQRLL